tara:strand:- start:498 stop:1574 length:1077 start_codon:yes stop_codon:yes gene_type:complete
MENIQIKSGQSNYGVYFVSNLSGLIKQIQDISNSVVVIDTKVAELYQELFQSLDRNNTIVKIDATEDEKSLKGVTNLLTFMQKQGVRKQGTVIAIGGGIIEDIAAFAAHVYFRGLRWFYIPTTLLSMCDSCIGAKVGINFNNYKNQLGFFCPPEKVLIHIDFLKTLSESDVESGYGEILKLSLVGPEPFWDEFVESVTSKDLERTLIKGLIKKSLLAKKYYIEIDEYDLGIRRILNYGHSFGHALEVVTGYLVPHGQAVVWGIDLANWLSLELGLLKENVFTQIHDLISECFKFKLQKKILAEDLLQIVRHDKKVSGEMINMILLKDIGVHDIIPVKIDKKLQVMINKYLSQIAFTKA